MFAEAVTEYLGATTPEEVERVGTAEMSGVRRQPSEVASAIVHLALDATYSTGSVVTVDGGFSAR